MEKLVTCNACSHGAILHEPGGCSAPACRCTMSLSALIEEALEAAKVDIRRDWHVAS